MAFTVHEIKKYSYSFDARKGSVNGLQLWGDQGSVAIISFIDDGLAVPPPTFTADLTSATATFRRSALAGLIDMLRNERPVSVTINNQGSGFVFVHTGQEPVGEGES